MPPAQENEHSVGRLMLKFIIFNRLPERERYYFAVQNLPMRPVAQTLLFVLVISTRTLAHEGMWIPSILGAVEDEMKILGLKLSPEELYAVNQSSLKDAIVLFGGGCTAELVSDQGLLFTNHHCGLDFIQYHSSLANNYIRDGFWAMNRSEELPCPGLKATLIVRIDDVTAAMNMGANDNMTPEALKALRALNRKSIEDQYRKSSPGLATVVRAFNYGNQFMAIVTRTYEDLRLVGAPPAGIGKFGGDTDNWVWPRHTGDFSVFRIYAGAANDPAPFSENNVPFKPARFLTISLDGVEEGDFSMVYGFPGRTEHFLTSYAVDYVTNKSNPMKIDMRTASLDVLRQQMGASDKVRIQYTAKQSDIANAWKKWKGQQMGLNRFGALEQKQQREADLLRMAADSGDARATDALTRLQSLYRQMEPVNLQREAFVEYVFYGPELFAFAHEFDALVRYTDSLSKSGTLSETITNLTQKARTFYKDYDAPTDFHIFRALTPRYLRYVQPHCAQPVQLPAQSDYELSVFADSTRLMSLLGKWKASSAAKLRRDPVFAGSTTLYERYENALRPEFLARQAEVEGWMERFVALQAKYFPSEPYWCDANSTLRISFGKVEGSTPADGMVYTYYTTSDGILQKYDPTNPDFQLPARLVEMLEAGDFGIYGKDGALRVCYTGSNHTTGGNSGSPALNAEGQLCGINFDRSWESTMSDILYNPEICRNIMVDIRYVLWVIDKYAGAGWLLGEMKLSKNSNERPETN